MNNQAAVSHPPQYPPPSRAWLLVTLLTIAYVVSFVDRYILSLLIDPIKADLGLSDFQIGILLGPAFGIFYATIGLPLGYLADRTRRTWIVAAGVSIWTMATALSGLARNFAQMLVARVSVGIGEAALSPCAMSLIADSFPEERRGKPIAMYSSALSVGAALAALLGSAVLFWTNSAGNITLPLVGELTPWRIAFLIAGLPGLLLVVPFLLMREPPRITAPTGAGRQNLGDMFRHVGRHALTYGCFVSVFCYMTIVAYSQGWLAVMFDRTFGWPVEVFALYDGLLLIVIGPVSVMFAGWLSDRQTGRGQRDAPMRIAILGLFLSVPMAVIGPLLGNDIAAFIVVSASTIGGAFISSVGVTALLKIVPVGIRAQTIALYYMAISLAGLFLGPSLVGLLNDQVFGADGVRYSVAVIPLIFGLPALLLSPLTLKLYRRALDNPEFSG